jgi:regulator of nucleoside diphosphate kinase
MKKGTIYISRSDAEQIRDLLRDAENTGYRGSHYIQELKAELQRAEIVSQNDLVPDIITMNSMAELVDIDTGEHMNLTLVFPDQADVGSGKISVLAPIGAAMLGYQTGDIFEWDTPGGKRTLRVEKVVAPPNFARA